MEIERDDEDFSFDYALEETRPYIEEHFGEEIAQNVQLSNLNAAALAAHREIVEAADQAIGNAEKRLGAGAWDEAIFHAARGVDGYATGVFVQPFREIALRTFREGLPHVSIVDTILSDANGLESGSKFVRVGFAATADEKETARLVGLLRAFLSEKNTASGWPIRNVTLHTLRAPTEAEATAFVTSAKHLLAAISGPLRAGAEAADKASRLAAEEIAKSKAWREG